MWSRKWSRRRPGNEATDLRLKNDQMIPLAIARKLQDQGSRSLKLPPLSQISQSILMPSDLETTH